jgi:hypothetical protein
MWSILVAIISRRGPGCVDFAALKPFVRPEHIKVFEFSPGMTVEQAQAGIAHIKSLWGEE